MNTANSIAESMLHGSRIFSFDKSRVSKIYKPHISSRVFSFFISSIPFKNTKDINMAVRNQVGELPTFIKTRLLGSDKGCRENREYNTPIQFVNVTWRISEIEAISSIRILNMT